jgi:hypothetical protein
MIEGLTSSHFLKAAPDQYKRDFIAAAERVYPSEQLRLILQKKFFIPDCSRFDFDAYL